MVKLEKIIDFLNLIAPPALKEDYDNVGLLVGDNKKEIKKVLITLDADENVIDEAIKNNVDLILSHHPLIFKPLKRITYDDSVSRAVLSLVKNDVALFSMHTNFDSVKGGLGDLFLDKIVKTKNRESLEGDLENGIGRIASVTDEINLMALLEKIKSEFLIDTLRYIGNEEKTVKKIAVVNGGGADFIYKAKELGADCFVSGDIKYHHARFAYENDISLIEIPHYPAEFIFCEYVNDILLDKFKGKIETLVSEKNIDIWKKLG